MSVQSRIHDLKRGAAVTRIDTCFVFLGLPPETLRRKAAPVTLPDVRFSSRPRLFVAPTLPPHQVLGSTTSSMGVCFLSRHGNKVWHVLSIFQPTMRCLFGSITSFLQSCVLIIVQTVFVSSPHVFSQRLLNNRSPPCLSKSSLGYRVQATAILPTKRVQGKEQARR